MTPMCCTAKKNTWLALAGQIARNADAFSLFELLVVLVIIGLAAALVVPRLGGGISKLTLRKTAYDIAAILRYARSQAVFQGQTQTVVFEPESRYLSVLPSISNDGASLATRGARSEENLQRYKLPDGVDIQTDGVTSVNDGSRMNLGVFFSMGNSSGGRIVLNDSMQRTWRIDIDLITGMVTFGE